MRVPGMRFLPFRPIILAKETCTELLEALYPCSHPLEGLQTMTLHIKKTAQAFLHLCPFLSCLWLRFYMILEEVRETKLLL